MAERIIFKRPQAEIDAEIAAAVAAGLDYTHVAEYAVLIPSGDLSFAETKAKDIPAQATEVREIDIVDLPQDRLFRNAWDDTNPEQHVGVNLTKAKDIAHRFRRSARDKEFAPYDEIIAKQIPGADAIAAENARQSIRTKYDGIQTDIDNAADEVALRAVLSTNNINENS